MKFYTSVLFSYVFLSIWSQYEAYHLLKSYVERKFKEEDDEKRLPISFNKVFGGSRNPEDGDEVLSYTFLIPRKREYGSEGRIGSGTKDKAKKNSSEYVHKQYLKNFSKTRVKVRNVFANFFPLGKPHYTRCSTTMKAKVDFSYLFHAGTQCNTLIPPATRRFEMIMCPVNENEEASSIKPNISSIKPKTTVQQKRPKPTVKMKMHTVSVDLEKTKPSKKKPKTPQAKGNRTSKVRAKSTVPVIVTSDGPVAAPAINLAAAHMNPSTFPPINLVASPIILAAIPAINPAAIPPIIPVPTQTINFVTSSPINPAAAPCDIPVTISKSNLAFPNLAIIKKSFNPVAKSVGSVSAQVNESANTSVIDTNPCKKAVFQHIRIGNLFSNYTPKGVGKYMYVVPSRDYLVRYNLNNTGLRITADRLRLKDLPESESSRDDSLNKTNTSTYVLSLKDFDNKEYSLPLKYFIPMKKYIISLNLTRAAANLTIVENKNASRSSSEEGGGLNVVLKIQNDAEDNMFRNQKIANNRRNLNKMYARKFPRSVMKNITKTTTALTKKAPPWKDYCPDVLGTKPTCVTQDFRLRNMRPWGYTCCFNEETMSVKSTKGKKKDKTSTTPVTRGTTKTTVADRRRVSSKFTPKPPYVLVDSSNNGSVNYVVPLETFIKVYNDNYGASSTRRPSKSTTSSKTGKKTPLTNVPVKKKFFSKENIKGGLNKIFHPLHQDQSLKRSTKIEFINGTELLKMLQRWSSTTSLTDKTTRLPHQDGKTGTRGTTTVSESGQERVQSTRNVTVQESTKKGQGLGKFSSSESGRTNEGVTTSKKNFWVHFGPHTSPISPLKIVSLSPEKINKTPPSSTVIFNTVVPQTALTRSGTVSSYSKSVSSSTSVSTTPLRLKNLKVSLSETEMDSTLNDISNTTSCTQKQQHIYQHVSQNLFNYSVNNGEMGKTTSIAELSSKIDSKESDEASPEPSLIGKVESKLNNLITLRTVHSNEGTVSSNINTDSNIVLTTNFQSSLTESTSLSDQAPISEGAEAKNFRVIRNVDKSSSTSKPKNIFKNLFNLSSNWKGSTVIKKQREKKPWETPWVRKHTQAVSNQSLQCCVTLPPLCISKAIVMNPQGNYLQTLLCDPKSCLGCHPKVSCCPAHQNCCLQGVQCCPPSPPECGPQTNEYYQLALSQNPYCINQTCTTNDYAENLRFWTQGQTDNCKHISSNHWNENYECNLDSSTVKNESLDDSDEDYVTYLLKFPKNKGIINEGLDGNRAHGPHTVTLVQKKSDEPKYYIEIPKIWRDLLKNFSLSDKDSKKCGYECQIKQNSSVNLNLDEVSNGTKHCKMAEVPSLGKNEPIVLLLEPFQMDNRKEYVPTIEDEPYEDNAILKELLSYLRKNSDLAHSGKSLSSKLIENKMPVAFLPAYCPVRKSDKLKGDSLSLIQMSSKPDVDLYKSLLELTTDQSNPEKENDIISEIIKFGKLAGLSSISETTENQIDFNKFNWDSSLFETTEKTILADSNMPNNKYAFMEPYFKKSDYFGKTKHGRGNIFSKKRSWRKPRILKPHSSYNISNLNPSDDSSLQVFVDLLSHPYFVNKHRYHRRHRVNG